jgi:hypothetical protein
MGRWKDLQFIKQVVIKPEDPKNPMWVQFIDDIDSIEYSGHQMTVSRDRSIKLGANTMYVIETDYPEDFKKLVAATGDCGEAYRIYKALQDKVPDNWADYDEGNVW